ncbi:hypothetical protein [Streptomyces sp. NPDC085479]|uniref:hypothetical protein n=1 Tax=Streptomyces sp. NPDC085479 TaxID=3365726 RepID=UPI0037D2AE54
MIVGQAVEGVDAVVVTFVALLRRAVGGCFCAAVPVAGCGERGVSGAGHEGLFGLGGVSAVDAAHELVEGVGEAGFVLPGVTVVAVNGLVRMCFQVRSSKGRWTWSRWIHGISVSSPAGSRTQIWRTSWGL